MSDENTSTPEPTPTAVTETLDEHNDNRYGNAWEIVQYSGVTQTFLWGFIIAALSGVTAWFFAPQPAWVAATLLGFTTGFIARIDNKTRLIKNTLLFCFLGFINFPEWGGGKKLFRLYW